MEEGIAGIISVGVLKRTVTKRPELSFLINVDEDGTISNKITGKVYSSLKEALDEKTKYGLVDARLLGITGNNQEATLIEKGRGVAGLESQIDYLNNFLGGSQARSSLQQVGLEHLAGRKLRGQFLLFQWKNDKSILERLMTDLEKGEGYFRNFPGFVNITDEGIQVFSLAYQDGDEFIPMTALDQSLLKSAANIPDYSPEAVLKFLGSEEKGADVLSKLPKRKKSEMAPRDLGFKTSVLEEALKGGKRGDIVIPEREFAFVFDPVDALLRTAGGGVVENPLTRLYLASASGAVRDTTSGYLSSKYRTYNRQTRKVQTVNRPIKKVSLNQEDALEEIYKISGLSHPSSNANTDAVKQEVRSALEEARQRVEHSPSKISMSDGLKSVINDLGDSLSDQAKSVLSNLGKNIETIHDGQFSSNARGLKDVLERFESQRALIDQQAAVGAISSDERALMLKELNKQAEAAQHLISEGRSYRSPTRAGGSYIDPITGEMRSGQFKGDAGARNFGDIFSRGEEKILQIDKNRIKKQIKSTKDKIIAAQKSGNKAEITRLSVVLDNLTELERQITFDIATVTEAKKLFDKYLIHSAATNVKSEVGYGQTAFITANVSQKSDSTVFIEPQRLMADPLSYTDPNFIARQKNITAQVRSQLEEFSRTGVLPEDFIRGIIREAEEFGIVPGTVPTFEGVPVSELSPARRAAFMARKAQTQAIHDALMSGLDPRSVPEVVNRYTTQMAASVFKMGQDGEVTLINPDAKRFKITTYEAIGARQAGVDPFGIMQVPVSDQISKAASSGLPVGSKPRTVATFVEFSIQGKHMVISGRNAAAYKAALGTFDLDDSGIPIVKTFTDARGKRRVAFTTVRDPSSIEEQIFMRMGMQTSAETIQEMFGDDKLGLDFFSKSFDENLDLLSGKTGGYEYVSAADIASGDAKRTYERMQKILGVNGKKLASSDKSYLRSIFSSNEAYIAEQMFLAGKERLGTVSSLDQNPYFIEAIARQSASTRGRDALNAAGISEQIAKNLSPEKGAPYLEDAFIEISSNPSSAGVHDEFLSQLRRVDQSYAGLTADEVMLRYADDSAANLKFRADVNRAFEELVTTKTKTFSLESKVENTVGSLINRTNASYSPLAQMRNFADNQIMSSFISNPKELSKFLGERYATGITPASDIVDIVKQLTSGTNIKDFADVVAERWCVRSKSKICIRGNSSSYERKRIER